MRVLATAAAVVLAATSVAAAEWSFEEGRDPLSDVTTGYIYLIGKDDVAFIAFKCWQEDAANLTIFLPSPYREPPISRDFVVPATFRADRDPPITFQIGIRPVSGSVLYSIEADNELELFSILRGIRRARSEFAVAVDGQLMTFAAEGSVDTIDRFREICLLPAS